MDFHTLSRRQLQSLCKNNKIPANITNVAMADALSALQFVEGVEEILNSSESEIAQSPMCLPTGGRTRTAKGVGVSKTPGAAKTTATRRRAAAASTSAHRKIEVSSNEPLDVNEEAKKDVSVKTPATRRRGVSETSTLNHGYNTRRSARLAEKIEVPKERSEAIEINLSFTEEINENVEVGMKECSVDQCELSEITVLDNLKECSEDRVNNNDESNAISAGNSDIPIQGDVAIASIEHNVASDIKNITDQDEDGHVDSLTKVSMKLHGMEIEDTKMYSDETKAFVGKDTEKNSNGDEVNASSEDTKMNSNVDEHPKASIGPNVDDETNGIIEDTGMHSNAAEETEALIEKDTEKNSNEDEEVNKDTKKASIDSNVDEEHEACSDVIAINSNVDDDTNASIEATDMNSKVDEEIKTATDMKVGEETKTSTGMKVGEETKAFTEETKTSTGMKVGEEAKASSEVTDMNFDMDEEAKASFEVTDMNFDMDEEAKASSEVTDMNFDVDEEAKASSDMNSDVDEEAKASSEVTDMNSHLDEEAKASSEVTEMDSNVDDGTKAPIAATCMISEVDEESKVSIVKDTDMNSTEDEEIIVAEYRVADSCNVDNEQLFNHDDQDKEHESYAKEIENHGDMAANVIVSIQETDNKEFDMSDENDTSNDEESDMSNEKETSDDEESDMSDENETSDDEESDMFDENETYENEEFKVSNISADVDANLTANMQETDEYETSDNEEILDISNITGDMVANVTVNIHDTDSEESGMSDENDTSDEEESDMSDGAQEDFVVPEVEIQDGLGKDELVDDKDNLESNFADDVLVTGVNQEDVTIPEDIIVPEIQEELLNSEAKHESNFSAIGSAAEASTDVSYADHIVAPLNDVLVSSIEPLKISLSKTPSNKSANRTPKTVSRLAKVSDDKENVVSGRKSVILIDKKPLEDFSIRKLSKMFKEKAQISEQHTEDDGKEEEEIIIKATPTRPALKTLSENCMAAESQN